MDHGALDNPLETGGRFGILPAVGDQVRQLGVDVLHQVAAQQVEIHVAGAHDSGRILIVDERQKQMFQGRVFMPALSRKGESSVKRLFKTARKARQGLGVL
jgi:hypothetical protein